MKMRHDLDATTIAPKRAKRAIAAAAIVIVAASSAAPAASIGAKARHDAMKATTSVK